MEYENIILFRGIFWNQKIFFCEYTKLLEEIEIMKKEDSVVKYCHLLEKRESLDEKIRTIYIQKKLQEYNSCNHLWVEMPGEEHSPIYVNAVGCVKCGIDTGIRRRKKMEDMNLEEQAIMEYSKVGINRSFDFVNVVCDLNLGRAIFNKINEQYPGLDNRTLAQYFVTALKDIRNIKVNEERQKNRAKRLGLDKKFKNWH